MKIEWNQKAKDDLIGIIDYISDDNPAAAQNLKNDIDKLVMLLQQFPQMGRLGRVDSTRELVVNDHFVLIYSLVSPSNIAILRVLSSYQSWPN
ncbi:type II toxin-antitoxin system RelE/ParE family toxin [Pseudidiomarina mangrovi]|uniref:type II toxin-antitoxin system RelE/ParE family toxin n=1 Tax=Pseudidiomarina mangrovi TaxID=2487133 RepID=UPI00196B31BB